MEFLLQLSGVQNPRLVYNAFMNIKLKAYALHYSLGLFIAVPVILLVIAMLLSYHIKFVRDSFGLWCADQCGDMLDWRRRKVYRYVTNTRQGYSLEVD